MIYLSETLVMTKLNKPRECKTKFVQYLIHMLTDYLNKNNNFCFIEKYFSHMKVNS